MTVNPLQHLMMPTPAFGAPVEMYFRNMGSGVDLVVEDKKISFNAGGMAAFDTFFNAISIEPMKRYCQFDDLFLRLNGTGRFNLRFGLHRLNGGQSWLSEQEIDLGGTNCQPFPVCAWPSLEDGLLYFCLEALTEAELIGGSFFTTTAPRQRVKLGLVITHFNRKEALIPAIRRIETELLQDPLYHEHLRLIVVDNSKTIAPDEAGGAVLIPNPNIGGSGGFARGLLHLVDDGSYTHCLFMDDDASCDVEAIRRAYHFFQFIRSDKIALAGSLLRDVEPYRIYEKGALFNGFVTELKKGLDMRSVQDLLLAEHPDRLPDYGAWWFFAFAISDVDCMPYPFFVRGDDILFSIQNRFVVATLNGICTWGADFGSKESPLTRYFGCRSTFVLFLLLTEKNRCKAIKFLVQWLAQSLFSYNYASAEAICMAISHVCRGSRWWQNHILLTEVRRRLAALCTEEKMRPLSQLPVDINDCDLPSGEVVRKASSGENSKPQIEWLRYAEQDGPNRQVHKSAVWGRYLTLNGFLIPTPLLKDRICLQPKYFGAVFGDICRYRQVMYADIPQNLGYIAKHDKKRFFLIAIYFAKLAYIFFVRFRSIRKDFREALPEMTSMTFWRRIYNRQKD